MERENMSFEDQWSEAFNRAEVTPPAHIWASIDGALANKEATGYKKRILFFKWVAAASIVLAIGFGIVLFNESIVDKNELAVSNIEENVTNEENNVVAETRQEHLQQPANEENVIGLQKNNEESLEASNSGEPIESNTLVIKDANEQKSLVNSQKDNVPFSDSKITEPKRTAAIALVDKSENEDIAETIYDKAVQADEMNTYSISYLRPKAIDNNSVLKPWEADFLYRVPDLSAGKDLLAYEGFDLWAGLSLGSGSFNPGTEGSALENAVQDSADPLYALNVRSFVASNSYASGNSFSAGMNLGGKVSKKILISSGLHYNAVSPGSSSSIIITDNQTNKSFALANDIAETESLNVGLSNGNLIASQGVTNFSNTLQYLTIPLKAGYVILDRKLNLTVNSGMATNILIGSSLNNTDGGLQNYGGSTSGNDSFSKTYFDLLTSIELGYRLLDKYHLSLEPNYRRAINNFTSEGNALTGKPTNFGVSVGIKYEF